MYAVINNGVFERDAVGAIVWSPNHFQTAESLSVEERTRFNLYLVIDVQPVLQQTQKWGAHTYTVSGTNVTRTWNAISKTAAELADEAAAAIVAANDVVLAKLAANDLLIIRALTENDAARIAAHRTTQTLLRAELR